MSQWILECPEPEKWREIILAKSELMPNGCRQWTGSLDRYGYGRFRCWCDGKRRRLSAHRAAWLAHAIRIEDGLVVDHLCRNRACVNVAHLEPVTTQVNTARGDYTGNGKWQREPVGPAAQQWGWAPIPPDEHQCRTHGQTDGYLRADRRGYVRWVCRVCRRASGARYRARQAA